jgi:hypothetical protein
MANLQSGKKYTAAEILEAIQPTFELEGVEIPAGEVPGKYSVMVGGVRAVNDPSKLIRLFGKKVQVQVVDQTFEVQLDKAVQEDTMSDGAKEAVREKGVKLSEKFEKRVKDKQDAKLNAQRDEQEALKEKKA